MSDLQSPPQSIPAPPPPIAGVRVKLFKSVRKTPERPCTNCGDPTVGNFCPVCGQRKVEVRVSLRRMLMEALDDQFSLNSALPRTLGALFFRPGHLTREYVTGRIARYIPPFRLYLVSSLVFFLTLSFLPDFEANVTVTGEPDRPTGLQLTLGDSADGARMREEARREGAARVERAPAARTGKWTDDVDFNTPWPALNQAFEAKKDELGELPPREAVRRIFSGFMEHIPQMMFLLLPVFAALLKLVYVRSRRFYVEHFVYALHLHSFVYLHYTLLFLVPWDLLTVGMIAWLGIYIFLSLKKVYGQGWIKTGIKYVTLGVTYFVLLLLAAFATLLVTILML